MLAFRYANESDVLLLFDWANEHQARQNSYNSEKITLDNHIKWFSQRIRSEDFYFYIFINEAELPVGQVRIEKKGITHEAIISIIVGKEYRGKGYGSEMIHTASADFIKKNAAYEVIAYIFKNNESSYRSFLKAGYKYLDESVIKDVPSYILKFNEKES